MRNKLPYIIVLALFIGYVLLEMLAPKPYDWDVSYGATETKPFGTKLLYERLPDIFPGAKIMTEPDGPADALKEFEAKPSNYIMIAGELDMATKDAHALLAFARRGNSVFVAAEMFTGPFADSLNVENRNAFLSRTENLSAVATANNSLKFSEDGAPDPGKKYPLMDYIHYNFFEFIPDAQILGVDENSNPVFIRFQIGEGQIFVHSVPLIFTNYYMVDPVAHDYISKALSYLPVQNVIWDDHYKPGHVDLQSSVAVLLESPSLRWAWILALGTLVLFVVFEGKRRQRIVPTLDSVTNTTLEFTQTVSRLYLGHADHKDIASKKIKFFLEYVRNRWMLNTLVIDEQFENRLAMKSGVTMQDVRDLCRDIRGIQSVKAIDATTLMLLNRKIESFYVNSQ
jgi:hypothetical protein